MLSAHIPLKSPEECTVASIIASRFRGAHTAHDGAKGLDYFVFSASRMSCVYSEAIRVAGEMIASSPHLWRPGRRLAARIWTAMARAKLYEALRAWNTARADEAAWMADPGMGPENGSQGPENAMAETVTEESEKRAN